MRFPTIQAVLKNAYLAALCSNREVRWGEMVVKARDLYRGLKTHGRNTTKKAAKTRQILSARRG
jgi:predicted membrane chloride channel (bestrophin family)